MKTKKIIAGKIVLYMSAAFLTAASPLPVRAAEANVMTENFDVSPMEGTVYASSRSGLNVRSGPSTDYDKIGTLQYGQEITVTGKIGEDWYQIRYSDGYGYVSVQYVSDTSPGGDRVADAQTPAPEIPDSEADAEPAPDTDTGTPAADTGDEEFSQLIGTSVIVGLAVAILGVMALIGYSVYGLFKRESPVEDPYDDGEYYDEEYYEEDDDGSGYTDEEYYEEDGPDAGYADEEYYEEDNDNEQ